MQPINHFTVLAPTVQIAAEDVAKRINDKDPVLSPAALEKNDNTIVTINTNKTAAVAHLENIFILNEEARLYNTKIKIFGNGNKLIIGENCKIKTKKRINFSKDIIIGDHVWIAAYAKS